jgi:hypothetical protein
MTDPKKDACEPTENKPGPSKQFREAERQRVVEEYVIDLREILKKLRKLFNYRPPSQARGWHGGEYPHTMPQAIKLIDAEGRSCIYVPITQDGKVVDSQGYTLDPEDD